MDKLFRIGTLIRVNLFNNPLTSWSLINLDFLLSHTAYLVESIILPF